ncbi:MAG TPA: alpha/beta fold hydrolase, partial [Acidimicrobiales bacterium]|nr:alpha/beta fold hydrolase [Acidimicrobiales bacterium]
GEGPLMLFLHGFPQFWYSWRHQLPEFATDHRAVAIDLRGYNDSDKPRGREPYRIQHLTDDVKAVIDELGGGKATLVGHDWGGVIAWAYAHRYQQTLDRLVVINAPHPARMRDELKTPGQFLKSWYIFFFQLPKLPELALTLGHSRAVGKAIEDDGGDGAAAVPEDLDRYRDAFSVPGVATSSVNYYRNFLSGARSQPRRLAPIEVPGLLVWGEQDKALGIRLASGNETFIPDLSVRTLAHGGHFVHEQCPAEVNGIIRSFLSGSGEKS